MKNDEKLWKMMKNYEKCITYMQSFNFGLQDLNALEGSPTHLSATFWHFGIAEGAAIYEAGYAAEPQTGVVWHPKFVGPLLFDAWPSKRGDKAGQISSNIHLASPRCCSMF